MPLVVAGATFPDAVVSRVLLKPIPCAAFAAAVVLFAVAIIDASIAVCAAGGVLVVEEPMIYFPYKRCI